MSRRLEAGFHPETDPILGGLIAKLQAVYVCSCFGALDSERGAIEKCYFMGDRKKGAPARLAFDEAAQQYGMETLRELLGPNANDEELRRRIAQVLTIALARFRTAERCPGMLS